MTQAILQAQRPHLGQLLDAIQRSTYYLHATEQRLPWPLTAAILEAQKKNAEWFETLAAMNERFAKLQDILASAMRHTGFYPKSTDTSEKSHNGGEECLCPRERSTAPSSSVKRLS